MKRHIKSNATPPSHKRNPLMTNYIRASKFNDESDFAEVLDYCLDHEYEIESEESLHDYAKYCIDQGIIGDAIEILTSTYEAPAFVEYYRYDFSGQYAPKPIVDVQDLLDVIDEFE